MKKRLEAKEFNAKICEVQLSTRQLTTAVFEYMERRGYKVNRKRRIRWFGYLKKELS